MHAADENCWPEELKTATREGLSTLSILPTPGGAVALKHVGGAFALLAEDDLLAGTLRLVDRRTGEVSIYPGADALGEAGWALD